MTSEAGWYPDPNGRHELRYWDGSTWTEHISNDGVAGTDPVSDATQVNPTLADQAVQEAEPGGPRWLPIGLGIVAVVAVVGGLFYFLGGDDDGSDSATGSGQLSADSGAVDFIESVGADQAIRFRVTPQGAEASDLDLAIILAADRSDAVSMAKATMGDQADGLDDDEILDQFGLASLQDRSYQDLDQDGIDTDLIMLGYRDGNGIGEPEADFFAAPDDVDLHIITFDLTSGQGDVGFESEKFSGDVDGADSSTFDDEWFNDPSFYGDAFYANYPFGVGGGLFDDLFDQLPDELGDLPNELDGLLEGLPEEFEADAYLADWQDQLDGMLEDLPAEAEALLDDLPDEFDSMFDELSKELEGLDPEDYFGQSGAGLEDFLNDLLEQQN